MSVRALHLHSYTQSLSPLSFTILIIIIVIQYKLSCIQLHPFFISKFNGSNNLTYRIIFLQSKINHMFSNQRQVNNCRRIQWFKHLKQLPREKERGGRWNWRRGLSVSHLRYCCYWWYGFFPSVTSVKRESCCRPEKSLSPWRRTREGKQGWVLGGFRRLTQTQHTTSKLRAPPGSSSCLSWT